MIQIEKPYFRIRWEILKKSKKFNVLSIFSEPQKPKPFKIVL